MRLLVINRIDSTNMLITFTYELKKKKKSKTKFKFETLIILPAKIIHICSVPPECFTACLCQCSASTSCFIIDRIGCKWAFIQATWRNSQPLLCIVIIGKKVFHFNTWTTFSWVKRLTIAIKNSKIKNKKNIASNICYLWLTSLDSNKVTTHICILAVNQKIYYGYLRGFPALDIHEMWNVH